MDLKTKLTYDFSAHDFTTDEKLKIIAKNEKLVKDNFTGQLDIIVTSDSSGDIWYKIGFYLNGKLVEFDYSDKTLYLTSDGYSLIKDTYNTSENPFYNHPVYFILDWLFNSHQCNNGKMSLLESIQFVVMVYNVLNTMVQNYSQWVNGL